MKREGDTMRHLLLASSISLLACPQTPAQTAVSIPLTYADRDAPSVGMIAGFCTRRRQQILVNAGELTGLAGRRIVALKVRRDAVQAEPRSGARSQLRVTLSTTNRDANDPSPVFAQNRGSSPQVVFDGTVSIPASPAAEGRSVGWTKQDSVRIAFDRPFSYAGGNLCIEVEGTPLSGSSCYWSVDYDLSGSWGQAISFGSSCGTLPGGAQPKAWAARNTLQAGCTAVFFAQARPGAPTVMALGSRSHLQGISLASIGAPGCHLWIEPATFLPVTVARPEGEGGPGNANPTLQIPAQPGLLGREFFVQWAFAEFDLPRNQWSNAAGLTMSQGMDLTISVSPPALGRSTVLSQRALADDPMPSKGDTIVNYAPVLRFELQ